MNVARPSAVWIGALAAVALTVVLWHEILLPFMAGIALAYLLDPVVEKIERFGVNRTAATLAIVGLFIIGTGAYWCWSRLSSARTTCRAPSIFSLTTFLRRSHGRPAADRIICSGNLSAVFRRRPLSRTSASNETKSTGNLAGSSPGPILSTRRASRARA